MLRFRGLYLPRGRLLAASGGVATSTYASWIAAAFGMTALWPHLTREGRAPAGRPPLASSRAVAARHFALPNSLRRTAAILSHWMPSVGLSSFGQASEQLVMVWQR